MGISGSISINTIRNKKPIINHIYPIAEYNILASLSTLTTNTVVVAM